MSCFVKSMFEGHIPVNQTIPTRLPDIANQRRAHIQRVLQRLARRKGCSNPDCGTHDPDVKFHWHHPGEKNFKVSRSCSMANVRKELKLCIPLCCSCHTGLHNIGNTNMSGKKHSQETKDLMSKAKTGKSNYWQGKKHTREARDNMSGAQRKRFEDPRQREKISVTLNKYWEKKRLLKGDRKSLKGAI